MGAKDDETSEICGVHYNVPGNDRRRVRAFMGATSDSAVIHKAFSKDDFRVTYPIEADFTSHTPAELAALRWLAAGKPATQVDLLTRNRPLFTCTGPQPELVSAPGRTILSRAWGRLGVDNEVSATLYLQLANNLPPYEPVRD